jgi:hypothetical protein
MTKARARQTDPKEVDAAAKRNYVKRQVEKGESEAMKSNEYDSLLKTRKFLEHTARKEA